jgi:hypothetical protein
MARDFTITQISSSNEQFVKLNNAPFIPFVLSIPGPISLREKNDAYSVNIGK